MFRDSVCHKAVSKLGFPDGSVSKESACSVGDPGPMPGSGRSTGAHVQGREGASYYSQDYRVLLCRRQVITTPELFSLLVFKMQL